MFSPGSIRPGFLPGSRAAGASTPSSATRPDHTGTSTSHISTAQESVALEVLHELGYEVETDWRPNRVELVAAGRGWVDVHAVRPGRERQASNLGRGLLRLSEVLVPYWPHRRQASGMLLRQKPSDASTAATSPARSTRTISRSWTHCRMSQADRPPYGPLARSVFSLRARAKRRWTVPLRHSPGAAGRTAYGTPPARCRPGMPSSNGATGVRSSVPAC